MQDIPRTFYKIELFRNSNSEAYKQVLQLLEASALYRPDIGYIQGMSFLAGLLLLYMDEYSAFVCLANLLNTHYFTSVCKLDLEQFGKHTRIYHILFSQHLPKLCDKFKELGIRDEHYLLDWCLTVFSKAFDVPLASRIWDCFLLEGEVFFVPNSNSNFEDL